MATNIQRSFLAEEGLNKRRRKMGCRGCGEVATEYCGVCKKAFCEQCYNRHSQKTLITWFAGRKKDFRAWLTQGGIMKSLMIWALIFFAHLPAFAGDQETLEYLEKEANDPASPESFLGVIGSFLSREEGSVLLKRLKELQKEMVQSIEAAKSAKQDGDASTHSLFVQRALLLNLRRLMLQESAMRQAKRHLEEKKRRREKNRRVWDEFNPFPLEA